MARPIRRPGEPELSEGMRLLDRYTILDRIGSGGMATIYRATDDRLDRVVCVKLLRTTLVEGSGSTSGRAVYQATYSHFLQEALALSKLQHPNTLRIYDFGYLDPDGQTAPGGGSPFHVSEYLDGGNLETHVRLRGPLSPAEALGILEPIAGAIAEAHEQGIIHRDIKPSNILFARIRNDLVPKLADFGIAHSDIKKHDRSEFPGGESVSTVALFSPRWAAPEQLCGSPEGPKTDVYALGLLTTFMLAGRVLFGDDDVRLTFNDRVRGDTLVNARLAQIGMTGAVGRVMAHAMAARPEDRIATAPELFEQLRAALNMRASASVAPLRADPPAAFVAPHIPAPPPVSGVSLEVEGHELGPSIAPAPELVQQYGERRVRYVQVEEKLDLSFLDQQGGQVRVRVTMLPGPVEKVAVKGLTCFVAKPGQRPTPALNVAADREPTGVLHLVSTGRQVLGELTWSFGQQAPNGRLFVVDGRPLLVPYGEAQRAVALMLSPGHDIVVMCRR
jgi:serine/threonine-protein kinase